MFENPLVRLGVATALALTVAEGCSTNPSPEPSPSTSSPAAEVCSETAILKQTGEPVLGGVQATVEAPDDKTCVFAETKTGAKIPLGVGTTVVLECMDGKTRQTIGSAGPLGGGPISLAPADPASVQAFLPEC